MRKPWLSIRLQWQHLMTRRGDTWIARVPIRKQRIPWVINDLVIAAYYGPEKRLELYDTNEYADSCHSFWASDRERITLQALDDLIGSWPAAEGLYAILHGDFAEEYRCRFNMDDAIEHWQTHGPAGWWIVIRRGIGLTLVRELYDINNRKNRAVEISYRGVCVFERDLLHGSDLPDQQIIMHLEPLDLSISRLTKKFGRESAFQIRLAYRHYRLMVYELALAIPF